MVDSSKQFYENFSFFTQSVITGHTKDGQPIGKMFIEYDKNRWPRCADWEGIRDGVIRPLCEVANSVTIWTEWRKDRREVLRLKKFVEAHFQKQGRYLVSDRPIELADEPLFWVGGGGTYFSLFQVMTFNMEHLNLVLDALRWHRQAGKKSPRSGGLFTSINQFAKTAVKKGGFAVVMTLNEAEIFVPLDYKGQTEEVAREVDARYRAEMGWD